MKALLSTSAGEGITGKNKNGCHLKDTGEIDHETKRAIHNDAYDVTAETFRTFRTSRTSRTSRTFWTFWTFSGCIP